MVKKGTNHRRAGRRRSLGPNPYFPALLTLWDRWAPEQIAQVLTAIDAEASLGEWRLSREIVLRLSRLYQRPSIAVAAPGAPANGDGAGADEEESPIGRCELCGKPANLTVENEAGIVQKVCNMCYGMTVGDMARPRIKEDKDAKSTERDQERDPGHQAG